MARRPVTVPAAPAAGAPAPEEAAMAGALKRTAKAKSPQAALALSAEFVAESRQNQEQSRNAIMKAVLSASVALRIDPNVDVREALLAAKVPLGTVKLIARIAPRVAVDKEVDLPAAATRDSITTTFGKLADPVKTTRGMIKHYGIEPGRVVDPIAALRRACDRVPVESRPLAIETLLPVIERWKAEQAAAVKAARKAAA